MEHLLINLASTGWETPVILFSLLGFFGLVVLGVIFAKKHIKGLQSKDDEPIDEEKAIEEELKRVLEPIEDEKIQEEMAKATHEKDPESEKDKPND
ncbi:MAG: LPXTG cell wall anchor domain-containing protein [Bacilli bacterium]|jgi:LPXTG-motif cell wall-anchored protein|nr:LPXTG cell wall anchor domain-containing protein [Bacilli bacterium]